MAQFRVNTQRFDPYKNFQFRVKWDGRYVAGVSKVGGLKGSTDVAEHHGGGDPATDRKSPRRSDWEAITLERGVTHDTDFEKWAEASSKHARRNITIEMYNESAKLAIRYKVYRCWVSEFTGLPDLGASANAVAIQSIKLENEGWKVDYEVSERPRGTSVEPHE